MNEFIESDKRVPSTSAKVGLGALTVLTGGLTTGLLVNKINRDKHADEWNDSWRERYETKYAYERMECLHNDERYAKKIDEEIKIIEGIKNDAYREINAEHEGFFLIDSLRNLESIDSLIELFDLGKANSIEEALMIFYSIDYSKYDTVQNAKKNGIKKSEHGWFRRGKSSNQ